MNDAYEAEVIITRRQVELPPPFVCSICERTVTADPWRQERHKPPVCNSCTIFEGHQVRFPGITRGDHTTLKRLTAVTNALLRTANWKDKGWH